MQRSLTYVKQSKNVAGRSARGDPPGRSSLTRKADGCLDSWSRQDVASKCVPPTSPETVKHYFLMPDLRAAVRVLLDK